MSKSFKKKPLPEHRNQVAREMIIEKVGVNAAKPMRAKQDRRAKDARNHWSREEY